MHTTFQKTVENLQKIVSRLESDIPSDEPFGIAHNNWSFPGLTKDDLIDDAKVLIELIEQHCPEEVFGGMESRLQDYDRRLAHLCAATIPNIWGSPAHTVSSYKLTMQGLSNVLDRALPQPDHKVESAKLRRLTTQVRSMEDRLKALDPRTTTLVEMVARIESAHESADQLPTDLASLAEGRLKLDEILHSAVKNQGYIEELRNKADDIDKLLVQSGVDAKSVIDRCESAYSAATSVGLAAAFTERSKALSNSMWWWVAFLVLALVVGSFYGSAQLHGLTELFKQSDVSIFVVILNLMLSVLSIGAPIWFGWLATKQIGHRFRLAEDYAFKASISRAYEGFRREAARVDKDMESRLLASALDRLDELPLRLIEVETHGSPWHELAKSDLIKEAIRMVPGFAEQVKDLAANAVGSGVKSGLKKDVSKSEPLESVPLKANE